MNRAFAQFPAMIVTGPRQSGKTTLVRYLFGSTNKYLTLDDPILREQAVRDPRLLFEQFPPPLILDEIQYAPDLLHYVKMDIDNNRQEHGRYIITGSQNFSLMQGVTESLAGRAAVLSLLSMSLGELAGRPEMEFGWKDKLINAGNDDPKCYGLDFGAVSELIYRGGFPEPALTPGMDSRMWHSAYVRTYLERDVRTLRAVSDLGDFQRLLVSLAQRSGSLINFADLGRDLGITANTVRAWVSILEASGQVFVLRPYFTNVGKRLVKQPKVYFLDTGILSYLLDIPEPGQALQGMQGGPVFETAVFNQLIRVFLHLGEAPRVNFWRTSAGHEVDFVVEQRDELIPIEVKLTATPSSKHVKGIEQFQELFGARAGKGLLVCLCKERFPLTRNIDAVPFGAF